MINRLHLSFPLILLIIIVLLTFWLDQAVQPAAITQDNEAYRHPDYIVENLSGIRMDHERVVSRTYSAEKMFHYLNEDITHLEKIHFMSTQPGKPLMRMIADRAELSGNGKDIYLTGNVTILRGSDDAKDKITMVTSFLHLIPDENIAKTGESVTISRSNTTIDAIGFELDNHTGMVQLLSRVRAVDK